MGFKKSKMKSIIDNKTPALKKNCRTIHSKNLYSKRLFLSGRKTKTIRVFATVLNVSVTESKITAKI